MLTSAFKITASTLVVVVMSCLASSSLFAQEASESIEQRLERLEKDHSEQLQALEKRYGARIGELEAAVGKLNGELEEAKRDAEGNVLETAINQLVQDVGHGRLGLRGGGHSLFDNTFNPSLSVVGDFALIATDQEDSFESSNQFRLRSVEIGMVGRVDSLATYNVILHVDEDEIELEEAYVFTEDWLPLDLRLKGGRYNIDFGKLSRVHDHGLPFVDKPLVLQEFLGGALRGTGLELHQQIEVGDGARLRWSIGIVNGLDGDSHPLFVLGEDDHGHGEEEGPEPFGERELDNFAFTARVTALIDVGTESTFQIGASVAWAPEDREFFAEEMSKMIGDVEESVFSADRRRLIMGVDLSYSWHDSQTGEGFLLASEVLFSNQDSFLEDDGSGEPGTDMVKSWGFYALGQYDFNSSWSIGVSGGMVESAEDNDLETWDLGGFATWHVDEFQRLRLEARYFDQDEGEDFFGVALQWTVLLGSHGQGDPCPCGSGNHSISF